MSCCARCGQNICSTAGKIALNKAWHKGCFCCYNCNRPLHVNTAKIYYGEVFCSCCCPQLQEVFPMKICRVNSTPSLNPECCSGIVKQTCCVTSESDCCRPRDVHSCSCIPACCQATCCDDEPCPQRRVHCRPRSPKPCSYPPRGGGQCTPRPCPCARCCPKRRQPPPPCQDPCCPAAPRRKKHSQQQECRCQPPPPPPTPCPPDPCSGKRLTYMRSSCGPECKCCKLDRCRRCGEKVFAAEKVLTAYGAYHVGCFSCFCCCKSLCVKTMFEACGEIYCKQCYNNYFGVSGYGYTCR